MIFCIKYLNERIGMLDTKDLSFKVMAKKFPVGFAPPFDDGSWYPNKEYLANFLKDRVIQEDNQGLQDTLDELGLPYYDLDLLIDKTYGMKYDDCFWLLPMELQHLDYNIYHLRNNENAVACINEIRFGEMYNGRVSE